MINVSGHRLSTMEVESAIVGHDGVAEAAVIGVPDELTGEAIFAFVTPEGGVEGGDGARRRSCASTSPSKIGKLARPKQIVFADDLPKTRSGKIMRRLLRDIAAGKELGDVTTLRDPRWSRSSSGRSRGAEARVRGGPSAAQPLLEREAELDQLTAALAAARSGAGSLLLIEGPAGIGKTSIIEEARWIGADAGMVVLSARAVELERDFAFGVARQLFEPALKAAGEGERERLLAGAARLAREVLEDPSAAGPSVPTADSSFASLHGLYWLLSNLSEAEPVLLAIDDLQWIDEASLRFATFLAPRLRELPVAMLATLRTGEPAANIELIERVAAESAATTMRPRSLSESATRTLLERQLGYRPDPVVAEAAHETAAGNPFLLSLLVREIELEGIEPREGAAERIRALAPRSVARTLTVRLRSLSDGGLSLAEAIAVLGEQAEPSHVAELAGLSAEEAIEASDALAAAGIIGKDGLSFAHPLIRNSAYEQIGSRRRAEMHRGAARSLAAAGAASELVATHLLLSDPSGDAEATTVLRGAARVAVDRGAPEVAVSYLERALAEPPAAEDRAAALYELGSAGARAGLDRAREDLDSALAAATDPATRTMAALELGQIQAYAGEMAAAAATAIEALASLGDEDSGFRAALEMLLLVLATTDLSARGQAADLMQRAYAAVERHGLSTPRGLLAFAAFDGALCSSNADRSAELAEAALAEGRILAEQGPEAPHPAGAAMALMLAGRFAACDRHLGDLIDAARGRGSARGYAWGSAIRAWTRIRAGDIDGAEADALACLELVPGPGWVLFLPMARSALALVMLERGEPQRAARVLEDAGGDGAPSPGAVFTQPLHEAAGRLALSRRDPEGALSALQPGIDWDDAWGCENGGWINWRPIAAAAHLALGRQDAAAALAERELQVAERFGAGWRVAAALRSVATTEQDQEAIGTLRRAVEVASVPPLERAGTLIDLGSALRRAGLRREAREALYEGLDLAARHRATALATRAHEELAASGARVRRERTSGAASLTARERQVAGRVAAGLSNPEIAQVLFISRKTVESHLRTIFRKLGIGGRDEVATALRGDADGLRAGTEGEQADT